MSNPSLVFNNYINYYDSASKIPASFSAHTEDASYPLTNIANWRLDGESRYKATDAGTQFIYADFGVGNTPDPDTLILAGHNTGDGTAKCRHQLYRSTDPAGVGWTSVTGWVDPDTNLPIMTTFTRTGGYRYWGLDFDATGGGILEIGQWFLGRRLDFPVGLQPGIDYHSATPAFYHDSPQHGSPLGRVTSHLNKSIRLDFGAPGFALYGASDHFWEIGATPNYDIQFMQHLAEGFPFWFSADNDNDPTELYYCWADGFSTPFLGSVKRRTFSGTCTGFKEVF